MNVNPEKSELAPTRKIAAWDPWVRVTHWSLVICVVGSWLTRELEGDWFAWHARFGYAVLVLVITRILWGLVGTHHARFANFVRGPRAIVAYLKAESREHSSGHNPLGALMIIALLALLLVQAVTGLFANDQVFETGPLFGYVPIETSDRLTTLHKQTFDWITAAIGVHVAAALFYLWVKRENLILPMITGRKRIAGSSAPIDSAQTLPRAASREPRWWLAVLIAGVVAGALAWLVTTAPEAGLYTF